MPSVTSGFRQSGGFWFRSDDNSGPYVIGSDGIPVLVGSNTASASAAAARSANAALTSAASSTNSAVILAANAARIGATIFNDSTATLYLALGAVASTTAYSAQVLAGGYYETPFGFIGPISGVWAAANGAARITELTA